MLDADYTFVNERLARHYGIADCVQCHRMMDPIGFALENFNAIGIWRSQDEGNTIDSSAELVDGSNVNGPEDLRKVMMGYSDQFVRVITEKLLTYALGRGADYHDMPLVRSVVRDAARKNYQFSSIVLGIVKSAPFQTNLKVQP